jgi:hypothetical protein
MSLKGYVIVIIAVLTVISHSQAVAAVTHAWRADWLRGLTLALDRGTPCAHCRSSPSRPFVLPEASVACTAGQCIVSCAQ